LKFLSTPLAGAYLVELEPIEDERGFFARSFCQNEFRALGLDPVVAQCNVSFNRRRGTLRGLHYQAEPYAEAKLVRCTRGAIWDVIVDLRRSSPTARQWFAVELTAENRWSLYVPAGFAHGFQTLVDDTEVFYQMSEFYHPEAAYGIRWDDPALAIPWPIKDAVVSPRDRAFPRLDEVLLR
jgi:dTDP-4-dehydrorhamnose 3,5-epimerase